MMRRLRYRLTGSSLRWWWTECASSCSRSSPYWPPSRCCSLHLILPYRTYYMSQHFLCPAIGILLLWSWTGCVSLPSLFLSSWPQQPPSSLRHTLWCLRHEAEEHVSMCLITFTDHGVLDNLGEYKAEEYLSACLITLTNHGIIDCLG
ncbi:unnamed protein product [Meganyctiphanes norvegica]|uniref:Uncharacterized protein n=1 Tax=Meganyctiphanes norvegica TaxID=48144 RepID=A0AAV2PIM5_MEGNR